MIYLNFDADWRRAFSAALRRNDRALLGSGADNPKALEGRLVRVRGWIEQRSGPSNAPTVELSTAGLIEVLDEPGQEGAPAPSLRGGRRASRPNPRHSCQVPSRRARKQIRPASSRPGGDCVSASGVRQAALTSASSAAARRPLALFESTSVMRCTAPRSSSFSVAAISRAMRSSAASYSCRSE